MILLCNHLGQGYPCFMDVEMGTQGSSNMSEVTWPVTDRVGIRIEDIQLFTS